MQEDGLQKVLFESDDAVVFVDFYTFERSQKMNIDVECIHSDQILLEAQEFADLVSPIFHVELRKGDLSDKILDGLTLDLIVELKNFKACINADSLVFIKKPSSSDKTP